MHYKAEQINITAFMIVMDDLILIRKSHSYFNIDNKFYDKKGNL